MNEISEDTWSEELNKLFSVKIQFREKLYSTEYEISNMERLRRKILSVLGVRNSEAHNHKAQVQVRQLEQETDERFAQRISILPGSK